jgi:hypothetical protein
MENISERRTWAAALGAAIAEENTALGTWLCSNSNAVIHHNTTAAIELIQDPTPATPELKGCVLQLLALSNSLLEDHNRLQGQLQAGQACEISLH